VTDGDATAGWVTSLDTAERRPSRPRHPAGRQRHPLDVTALPRHRARLQRAALALCESREDAEDLVQETFERVLRRPRLLHGDDPLGYLLRVLHNAWISTHRSRARRPASDGPLEDVELLADAHGDPGERVAARDAWAAISTLPDGYRKTFVAVDVLGLSYREAALALHVRQGTVMSRLFRARKRLAEALDPAA